MRCFFGALQFSHAARLSATFKFILSVLLDWLFLTMYHSPDHAVCFCPGVPVAFGNNQFTLNALFEALGTGSRRQPSYDHPRRCLLAGIHKTFLSELVFSPELEDLFL
jgi:hypothetical protein